MAQTLYDKIWRDHLVTEREDGTGLIYIDRHLLHEVTSPQAFDGLKLAGRRPWRIDANLATPDHNVPTTDRELGIDGITDETSRIQVVTLDDNCRDFGIQQFDIRDVRQGIVHVVGPEQGATLPGMTIVCGDSHTSTHGAFGALAQGIGTSEVEHVLATQCLVQRKTGNMEIRTVGTLGHGLFAKDLVLAIIGRIGTAGGTGQTLEFRGPAIEALTMEGRMTVCNMAIEGGARAGLIAVDDVTFDYLKGRPFAPKDEMWDAAVDYWRTLNTDSDAVFDRSVTIDAAALEPQVTWGTSPELVTSISGRVPDPSSYVGAGAQRVGRTRAGLYGTGTGPRADRYRTRSRVHRLVYQRAHRRLARGRRRGSRSQGVVPDPPGDGGSGLRSREAPGRGGRTRARVPRRRFRVAQPRLFDVSRHERRPARTGRAVRCDLEPEFRRSPGTRRPHASRQPGDGGGRGRGGHFTDVRELLGART